MWVFTVHVWECEKEISAWMIEWLLWLLLKWCSFDLSPSLCKNAQNCEVNEWVTCLISILHVSTWMPFFLAKNQHQQNISFILVVFVVVAACCCLIYNDDQCLLHVSAFFRPLYQSKLHTRRVVEKKKTFYWFFVFFFLVFWFFVETNETSKNYVIEKKNEKKMHGSTTKKLLPYRKTMR